MGQHVLDGVCRALVTDLAFGLDADPAKDCEGGLEASTGDVAGLALAPRMAVRWVAGTTM